MDNCEQVCQNPLKEEENSQAVSLPKAGLTPQALHSHEKGTTFFRAITIL